MRLLKDILIWVYWYPVRLIVQRLPLRLVYGIARTVGILAHTLSGRKRHQLEQEFREVFEDVLPEGNASRSTRSAFILWQQTEFEVLLYSTLNPDNIDACVRFQGREHLDAALAAGRGVMLLFAHFGANQMIMPAIGYKGYSMSQLSAPPTVWVEKLLGKKFSAMDKKALALRWEQELSLPVQHINIFGSLKRAFIALRNNEILGVAIDGGGGKKRAAVAFLGGKAFFSTGAIELAMKARCAVLPVFMLRGADGVNTMVIEPPLDLGEGDDGGAVQRNVENYIARFEPYVLRYPEHYLMFLALRRFMEAQGDSPFLAASDRKA